MNDAEMNKLMGEIDWNIQETAKINAILAKRGPSRTELGERVRVDLIGMMIATDAAAVRYDLGTKERIRFDMLCDSLEREIDDVEANYGLDRWDGESC